MYLASRLKELKNEREELYISYQNCREALDSKTREADNLHHEVTILKHDNIKVTDSLENEKNQALNTLKETMLER